MAKLPKALILLTGALLLAACRSDKDPAARVVEEYMQAIVEQDPAAAVNLSCAAWESGARAEAASFASVRVELPEIACSVAEELSETERRVTCQGSIKASYGAVDQEIPLEGRTFHVVLESGEWRVCGYR